MIKITPDFYNPEKTYRERLGFSNYTEGLDCSSEIPLSQQQYKDECDINNIVARHGERELYNHALTVQNSFQDISDVPTYHEALNMINAANDGFMELPAKIRTRFNNDPGELIEFLQSPDNRNEAISLGLINKTSETIAPQRAVMGEDILKPEAPSPDRQKAGST